MDSHKLSRFSWFGQASKHSPKWTVQRLLKWCIAGVMLSYRCQNARGKLRVLCNASDTV